MEYLTLPLGRGLNVTDSAEAQGGYMVAQLNNLFPLPGGGYQTIGGSKQLGSTLPGTGPVRAIWEFGGDLYAIRDSVPDAIVYRWDASWVATTTLTGSANGSWDLAKGNIDGVDAVFLANGVTTAWFWNSGFAGIIVTGMSPDTPNHVAVFKKRLLLSFGSSLQFSAVGNSTTWTPVLGAGEILMPESITALRSLVGNTLGIWSENNFSTITGTSTANFVVDNLNEYGNEIGAQAGTVQQLGNRTFFLGSRGVMELTTAREFGDFNDATISQQVEQLISYARNDGVPYDISFISRETNRYGLFQSSTGKGLILTLRGSEIIGWSTVETNVVPSCMATVNPADASEKIYAGDQLGNVYEMFDSSLRNFSGSTRICNAQLLIPSFGPGNPRVQVHGITANIRVLPPSFPASLPVVQARLFSQNYDPFELSSEGLEIPVEYGFFANAAHYRGYLKVNGTGSRLMLQFQSFSTDEDPYVIDSVTLAYTVQGEDYYL